MVEQQRASFARRCQSCRQLGDFCHSLSRHLIYIHKQKNSLARDCQLFVSLKHNQKDPHTAESAPATRRRRLDVSQSV